MNPVKSSITAVLVALSPFSSLALPPDSGAALAATFPAVLQPPASVVYKNAAVENWMAGNTSVGLHAGFSDTDNFLSRVKNNRVNNLSMEIQLTDMYFSNDRASFKVYAPMETMNRALSVAKTFRQTSFDDVQTTWAQTLLLANKRKVNAELAYSVNMSRHSNFDSAIIYRLNPDTGSGKPDTVASLRYSTRF